MLYFNPPYHQIQGLTLFPDSANDEKPLKTFYYLPMGPHLSTDRGSGKPVFQFLKYVDEAAHGGGYLSLQVDLSVDPGVLKRVIAELAPKVPCDPKDLNLVPVQPSSGTVKFMMFAGTITTPPGSDDKQTVDTTPTVNQAASPALYGDNQAIFAVSLDATNSQLLEQSLALEASPIGIIYDLKYTGLQPSYRVKVSADWQQVATSLETEFGANFGIASTKIQNAVNDLISKKLIKIDAEVDVTGSESADVTSRENAMVNRLTDMITNHFFEPVINPLKDAAKDKAPTGVAKTAQSLRDLNEGLFHYNRSTAKDTQSLNLAAEATERIAVDRRVAPQAFLTELATAFQRGGKSLKDYVKEIHLDDPFYQTRRVTVINRADFARDGIASIKVDLRYGDSPKPVLVQAPPSPPADSAVTKDPEVSWPARKDAAGKMIRDVQVGYTVEFKEDGDLDGQRPSKLVHPTDVLTDPFYEIRPWDDLYSVQIIEFAAESTFPWDRYAGVTIDVRYTDKEHGVGIERTVRLDKATPTVKANLFLVGSAAARLAQTFDYRITYRGAANVSNETRGWQKVPISTNQHVEILDPFPGKCALTVYADDVDWTNARQVFVDLHYQGKDHQPVALGRMVFTSATAATPQVAHISFPDISKRDIEYDLTVRPKTGSPVKLTGSVKALSSADEDLFLDAKLAGERYVQPVLDGGALNRGYPKITLELKPLDSASATKPKTISFEKDSMTAQPWTYTFSGDAAPRYQYRVHYIDSSGIQRATYPKSGNFAESDAVQLLVEPTPPR